MNDVVRVSGGTFTYPHMCRMGHVEIGHRDSEHEQEMRFETAVETYQWQGKPITVTVNLLVCETCGWAVETSGVDVILLVKAEYERLHGGGS